MYDEEVQMRQILFLAHRFEVINVGHNPKNLDVVDRKDRLYDEIRSELKHYGTLTSERTSSTRMKAIALPAVPPTPSDTVVANPETHSSTLDALDRAAFERHQRQRELLESVDRADYIVAAVDSESETRGSLIEYAHQKRKSILLLQQVTPLDLPSRPLYHDRPGITYVIYGDVSELKTAINRFFNSHPVVSVAG